MGQGRQIEALLQKLPPQGDCFGACPQAADIFLAIFADGDGGHGGEPGLAPVEGADGLALRPLREQGQAQLLHGIAVLMAAQDQFHGSLLLCHAGVGVPLPGQGGNFPMAGIDIVVPWQGL